MRFDAELLIVNRMGAKGFTGQTVDKVGVGGSELEVTQVAESVAALGHDVVVCAGELDACVVRGVRYEPWSWTDARPRRRVRTAVMWRMTPPPEVLADKYVCRATDVSCAPYAIHNRGLGQGWTELVCVSKWQARGFPFARVVHVIPPMMGGIDGPLPDKDPNLFVYASAPSKGLPLTREQWNAMCRKYPEAMAPLKLNVVLPGRSYTELPVVDPEERIELVGTPTVERYRWEIARAAGIFAVSGFAETFGGYGAFAERFGGRAHILALAGRCGMTEALVDGGRYLTTDRETFERQFLEALREPQPAVTVVERSPEALAPDWIRVLSLTA
jgi:hypothetical protein